MARDWYYAQNNEQKGPVTREEMLALEQAGLVAASTLVWKAGLPQWQPWSSVAAEVRSAVPPAGDRAGVPAGSGAGEVAVCAYSGQARPISLMARYGDRWVALEHKEAFLQSLREGASVARMVGVSEQQYVGFWWRVLAFIIDIFVLLIPNLLVASPYYYLSFKKAWARGGATSMDPLHEFKTMDGAMVVAYVAAMAGSLLIPLVYETWMIGRFGATVGKLTIGARVTKPDGKALTYLQSLGRHGAKFLNLLIWVLPANAAMVIGALISFGTGVQTAAPAEVPVAMFIGMGVMMLWFGIGCFGFYMAGWTQKAQTLHDKMARTVVVKKNPV
jgi:uncharacterized RDD family membrane protein YckC